MMGTVLCFNARYWLAYIKNIMMIAFTPFGIFTVV